MSNKLNKRPKRGVIKGVIKGPHDVVVNLFSNKHTIKRFFTMLLFLFYIPNNITEVFFTDLDFLYTINELYN